MSNKHCPDCGVKHRPYPSLKDRGMTQAEYKSIFLDARGGRCVPCFIKHRNDTTIEILRRNGR